VRRSLPGLVLVVALVGGVAWFVRGDADSGDESDEREGGVGGEIELDGAWFVVYADDPRPYLDVAFATGAVAPAAVTAHLAGPSRGYSFTLFHNPEDGEWQCDCTSLPPLEPGVWWIPRVDVTLADGAVRSWLAASAWHSYEGTDVGAGFFFVPAPGRQVFNGSAFRQHIETAPVAGTPVADTAIFVFREDDLVHWVAAADDPTTTSPYAILDCYLEEGRYLVRVDGSEESGGYFIRLDEGPEYVYDEAEPDGPDSPSRLIPGHSYHRTVGGDDRSDWFVIDVPDEMGRIARRVLERMPGRDPDHP